MASGKKMSGNKVGIAVAAAGISSLAAMILDLPLGLENVFQYGLAPLGGFLGVAYYQLIRLRMLETSVFGLFLGSVVLLLVAILCLFLYLILYYTVSDPTSPLYIPIIFEAIGFTLFFFFLIGAGYGAGLELRGKGDP